MSDDRMGDITRTVDPRALRRAGPVLTEEERAAKSAALDAELDTVLAIEEAFRRGQRTLDGLGIAVQRMVVQCEHHGEQWVLWAGEPTSGTIWFHCPLGCRDRFLSAQGPAATDMPAVAVEDLGGLD